MTLTEQFKMLILKGNRIELPEDHLPDYAAIKKVMTNNLGTYKQNGFNFDYNPAEMLSSLQAGQDVNLKKKFHFFPTPNKVTGQVPIHTCVIAGTDRDNWYLVSAPDELWAILDNDDNLEGLEIEGLDMVPGTIYQVQMKIESRQCNHPLDPIEWEIAGVVLNHAVLGFPSDTVPERQLSDVDDLLEAIFKLFPTELQNDDDFNFWYFLGKQSGVILRSIEDARDDEETADKFIDLAKQKGFIYGND